MSPVSDTHLKGQHTDTIHLIMDGQNTIYFCDTLLACEQIFTCPDPKMENFEKFEKIE